MAADPITKSTVDDLLDFDFSDAGDPFGDRSITKTRDDKPTLSPRAAKRKLDEDKENLGLGLDEEVKITKKRKPIVKLDEARLLSEPGIPRLRALARSGKMAKKLGIKGKGHEFSDVARLLNYYQLWLDGLYPRAKFADGLQLIEKAGHSKRMNVMRKEWIDEGKPGYIRQFEAGNKGAEETLAFPQPTQHDDTNGTEAQYQDNAADLFFVDFMPGTKGDGSAEPDEDELDALLAEKDASSDPPAKTKAVESEGEDDLDALLAEHDSRTPLHEAPVRGRSVDEEDDLDAVLAKQESRAPTRDLYKPTRKQNTMFDEDDNDENDNDELDALLAERRAAKSGKTVEERQADETSEQSSPFKQVEADSDVLDSNPLSSSPLPNNPEEEDDLDALLAEHEAEK